VLLEAMRRVGQATLVLVGDGPERERLVALAEQLGVSDRTRFVGSVPREDALRFLSGAAVAVLSSSWENLPHSAVEALAVGTPVVSTAVGGVPEVVHDRVNGLLVPPDDPGALAAALTEVLDDEELRRRLAAAAQPSVAAIGRDAVYERLEAILRDATA
jgi:glycosyltransferase involved in cell wall biosynthesis